MNDDFEYDAFISFSSENSNAVGVIYEQLKDFQINVFWSERNLRYAIGSPEWRNEIAVALTRSRHFILICTPEAMTSDWVTHEYTSFFDIHIRQVNERRFFIIEGEGYEAHLIPIMLAPVAHPVSLFKVIQYIVMEKISRQTENIKVLHGEVSNLQNNLTNTRDTVRKALQQYLYTKFWDPIIKNQDVHLFLCARDTPPDDIKFRGSGGRTAIDKWDYQTVLDITHFIIRTYSNTHLTIEEPISKLPSGLISGAESFLQWEQISKRLRDKDCIIIGSPDVSDLAELVLSKLHAIAPYQPGREKKKGYVIIKKTMRMPSTFYWEKQNDESEGVAQILDSGKYEFYPTKIENDESMMYGILVIADNPFGEKIPKRKIMIFSGFSGVATNGIAKLLTDERYVDQLDRLDIAYNDRKNDVEILIGVKFRIEDGPGEADLRKIVDGDDAIFYDGLVYISDHKPSSADD